MEEIWKDFPGYEKYFSVSSKGRVFNKRKNRMVKTSLTNGYYKFTASVNGVRLGEFVHRLVARLFLKSPSQELVEQCSKEHCGVVLVRHMDNNKLNNCASNLQWGTVQDNSDDWTRTKGYSEVYNKIRGTSNVHAKFSEDDVKFIRDMYTPRHALYGARGLARMFSVNQRTIRMIVKRITYSDVE